MIKPMREIRKRDRNFGLVIRSFSEPITNAAIINPNKYPKVG